MVETETHGNLVLNSNYEFEERPYEMGVIGEVDEPLLNYTLDLINSRNINKNQPIFSKDLDLH